MTMINASFLRCAVTACLVPLGALLVSLPAPAHAQTPVSLELVTEPGFPIGGERRWSQMLGELPGVTIRIRGAQGAERPEAEDRGGRIHVVGLLTSQNMLILPGGSFRSSDVRGIKAWLERLRDEGAENLTAPVGTFGLTESQFNQLNEALQKPVVFSTLNLTAAEFVERMGRDLAVPLELPTTLERHAQEVIADELQGLSAGTSLAAALRPCGLVIVPQRSGGRTILMVAEGKTADEFWPVGWASGRSLRHDVPALMKFVSVGISDTPLDEAVTAIQQRIEAPVLWDRNAMAREGIEPHEVKVTLPAARTYYKRILDKLLIQAKMRCEVRVDETGKAFVWLTAGHER